MLPFLFKKKHRNVFLPYQTLVLWFQVGPKFNILCDSGFELVFSYPRKLCHLSYEGFIHLEFILTDDYFYSIESQSKSFYHLLVRALQLFTKIIATCVPEKVDIPLGVIPGN